MKMKISPNIPNLLTLAILAPRIVYSNKLFVPYVSRKPPTGVVPGSVAVPNCPVTACTNMWQLNKNCEVFSLVDGVCELWMGNFLVNKRGSIVPWREIYIPPVILTKRESS